MVKLYPSRGFGGARRDDKKRAADLGWGKKMFAQNLLKKTVCFSKYNLRFVQQKFNHRDHSGGTGVTEG